MFLECENVKTKKKKKIRIFIVVKKNKDKATVQTLFKTFYEETFLSNYFNF